MRQAIRALGWATNILWILTIAFTTTSVLSMNNVFQNIGFGEAKFSSTNKSLVLSLPFSINNTGYYDISDLNVTTQVSDSNGLSLSTSTTLVPLIPTGGAVRRAHNITLDIEDTSTKDLSYLLFNDSNLDLTAFIALKFAYAIPLQISTKGTIPWGAPLSNFSIGAISYSFYNVTHFTVLLPVSFENHSPLEVNGKIRFEAYDAKNNSVGSGTSEVSVPPHNSFNGQVKAIVRGEPRGVVEVHVYVDTSLFSYGPLVMRFG